MAEPLSAALLDTSVLIALFEPGELALPASAAISVITLGELTAGVERATSPEIRAPREARLAAARSAFRPIPVDLEIAERYGQILAWVRSQGRSEKASDLLIVATAGVTERVLYTLDRRQASIADGVGVGVKLAHRADPS